MERLHADAAYTELARALARGELRHVDADRVLFVAGAARRESKASIRPLTFGGSPPSRVRGRWQKPRITVAGVEMFYEICLRPRFFLASTADERLEILIHELWHAAPAFDGTLAEERRHERLDPAEHARGVAAIARAWRAGPAVERERLERVLAHRGELVMNAWLSRPPTRFARGARTRAEYTERDLYPAIIEQTWSPRASV